MAQHIPLKKIKSKGTTKTERLLTKLCEKLFISFWSYPNPYKKDGKELCDLLVVFDNHILIFFDREVTTLDNDKLEVTWGRWKRKVIDSQTRTIKGAEKYIKNGGDIFIDNKLTTPLPVIFNHNDCVIYRFIIAHGAKEMCLDNSKNNIFGSLAMSYSKRSKNMPNSKFPYMIYLDKEYPIHVLDSHNLPIIMNELDTFHDFISYINAKNKAISKYNLFYCGEEDLLAHYFYNYDKESNEYYIGTKDEKIDCLFIEEGGWKDFVNQDFYRKRQQANKDSYLWDKIIQNTSQYALNDEVIGNQQHDFGNKSAIFEMAKEPRIFRRGLSKKIKESIQNFPESIQPITRKMLLIHSFDSDKAYVFLQLKIKDFEKNEKQSRIKRVECLKIACGCAKNKFDNFNTIVGIVIYPPKYTNKCYEDFIVLNCSKWTHSNKIYYEHMNQNFGFFQTGKLNKMTTKNFTD